MILSKLPLLLRNITFAAIQHESGYPGVLVRKYLRNDIPSMKLFMSTQQQNEQQQDSMKEQGTPDKLYKKVEVEVRGNDPAVLKSYGIFATMAANHLKINIGRNTAPYKAIHERWTVLKSAHVHKKHRVQYEIRTYYRYLDFLKLTGSTADTFLEYLQRNLPEGVAMKVTKVEMEKLPESIAAIGNT
ncbi:PREDICTED: 28S ribosomal protein S10, mitochondrial isoform X2 [Trachymyrmex septentrionalis]|uniref:28S ribosomal protein S10, mitochondrial isoform X2 n=1 Tax=Trachymyrmex septentrionalis TaxID=34720 RepID=UPI00084F010D|nr:PREDICTED: 28S ribosomal protein S10, mitochondrial isoform X2 [Trachymyrmex septentrionalis]